MTNYEKIVDAFVTGEPIKLSWYQRTKDKITRMFVENDTLMSYGRFPLAWRDIKRGQLVVNGDNGPSMTTRKQQRIVRDIARTTSHDGRVAIVPFSAMRAARVSPDRGFALIDVGPDRDMDRWVLTTGVPGIPAGGGDNYRYRADGKVEVRRTVHFLGEVLFRAYQRYFLCGLDRNDDPNLRNFYLTQLYTNGRPAPRTIEEALAGLRPAQVPEDAPRQGEYFFVPAPDVKPKASAIIKAQPILSEHSDVMVEARAGYWHPDIGRRNRHVASRMYLNGSVYVQGLVRDAEHTNLKLGDGKMWFRVVRNTALAGWDAVGGVD
jgi:hypothetical protein